jgi:catechol 2,3-dioxygenase-like lactoylglutathione lyase family enzyme
MLEEVAYVTLAVRNLSACRSVYGNQLGLSEFDCGGDWDDGEICIFAVGPSALVLRADPAAPIAPAISAGSGGPAPPPAVVDHFALYTPRMDDAYAALKDRNIASLSEPSTTAVGHRNMQRALLAFEDPNGLHVQISETVDPRPHLEDRRAAKRRMARERMPPGILDSGAGATDGARPTAWRPSGFDHISTYCADFERTRAFYKEQLGLEEFFHSTTREAGLSLEPGFAQSAFAVGGTDIELATHAGGTAGPTTVRELGFWTDDIDRAYRLLKDRGVAVDGCPSEETAPPHVRSRALALRSPDGLAMAIVQRL